jgi:hypothetical protein
MDGVGRRKVEPAVAGGGAQMRRSIANAVAAWSIVAFTVIVGMKW